MVKRMILLANCRWGSSGLNLGKLERVGKANPGRQTPRAEFANSTRGSRKPILRGGPLTGGLRDGDEDAATASAPVQVARQAVYEATGRRDGATGLPISVSRMPMPDMGGLAPPARRWR